jgi:hypothetical protein
VSSIDHRIGWYFLSGKYDVAFCSDIYLIEAQLRDDKDYSVRVTRLR